MATFVPAKRATQFIFYGGVASQANSKILQVNPTIAAGDFKVSIDGGALANLGTLPVVTPAGGRGIKFTLSVAEMTGDNIQIVGSDVAGAEWCDFLQNIQTAARQVDDLAFPATSGRSMVVDAAGLVDSNVVKLGPTGVGTAQTARDVGLNVDATVSSRASSAALATVQADTDDIQTRLPAALVGGRIDASVGAMAANVVTAAAIAANAITAAKVATDAIGAAQLAADAVTEIQSGLATSASIVAVQADTDNIQTRLPAALVGGRMDSSVGTMAADVMTAAATAADYVTELQAGLALNATVAKDATVSKEATLNAAATAILTAVAAVDTDVWTTVLDAGLTATEIVRLIAAACAGKLSGAATPVNILRSLGDTKNRITANVDASGNRTGVAYDVTP